MLAQAAAPEALQELELDQQGLQSGGFHSRGADGDYCTGKYNGSAVTVKRVHISDLQQHERFLQACFLALNCNPLMQALC
jgi:hypothetical protein